jgi:hypothetical protein
MTKRSTAVGLDVHKDSIDVSIAEEVAPGRCVTTEGEIPSDRFDTLIERLRRHGGQVRLVYEAVRAASRCIAIGAVGESTARRCLLSWAGTRKRRTPRYRQIAYGWSAWCWESGSKGFRGLRWHPELAALPTMARVHSRRSSRRSAHPGAEWPAAPGPQIPAPPCVCPGAGSCRSPRSRGPRRSP